MVNDNERDFVNDFKKLLKGLLSPKIDVVVQEDKIENYNVLFISYDVVNSTKFKNLFYDQWLDILINIFRDIQEDLEEKIKIIELWRMIGDEIVFIVKVNDIDILSQYIEDIFTTMKNINKKIDNGKYFKKKNEKYFKTIKENMIGLKSAAWIANLYDETKVKDLQLHDEYENVFIRYTNNRTDKITKVYEFLGNDIDAGFRIKQYTQKDRLIISFELAYILSEKTENNNFLHIIGYKKLKGVWNNKLYPIIWYHNDYKPIDEKFMDTFLFDAAEEDELIYDFFQNIEGKNRKIAKTMFVNTNNALEIVLKQRKLNYKIEKIKSKMEKKEDYRRMLDNSETENNKIKLQLSAICYDKENKKVLIFKRNKNRVNDPEKWEFGHILADGKSSFIDCLKQGYKEKYGVKIEICNDKKRYKDNQPIPLYIYQYFISTGSGYGITMLAKVIKNESNISFPKEEYIEFRWIKETDINIFKEDEIIPDFKDSLHKAFLMIKNGEIK